MRRIHAVSLRLLPEGLTERIPVFCVSFFFSLVCIAAIILPINIEHTHTENVSRYLFVVRKSFPRVEDFYYSVTSNAIGLRVWNNQASLLPCPAVFSICTHLLVIFAM